MSSYRFSGPVGGSGNHFGDDGTVVNIARPPAADAAAALVREVRSAAGHLPDGARVEAAAARIAAELDRPRPDRHTVDSLLDSIEAGAARVPSVGAAVGQVRTAIDADS